MAFMRQYMTAGDPVRIVRRRSPARQRKAAQLALVLQQLRGRQGPRRLGGRMRSLALSQGDPFRLRLPKALRKLKPGKFLAKVAKIAAPIVGTALLPGIGTVAGGLLGKAAGALGKARDIAAQLAPSADTLTGPGAPSQDYHDQLVSNVPVVSGTEVTPETSGMVYQADEQPDEFGTDELEDQAQADTSDEELLNQLLALLE